MIESWPCPERVLQGTCHQHEVEGPLDIAAFGRVSDQSKQNLKVQALG